MSWTVLIVHRTRKSKTGSLLLAAQSKLSSTVLWQHTMLAQQHSTLVSCTQCRHGMPHFRHHGTVLLCLLHPCTPLLGLYMAGEKIWRGKHKIDIQKYNATSNPTGELPKLRLSTATVEHDATHG